jgi:Flp pilus assembly protein TadB
MTLPLVLAGCCTAALVWWFLRGPTRTPEEVIEDLSEQEYDRHALEFRDGFSLEHPLAQLGLLTRAERRSYQVRRVCSVVVPLCLASVAALIIRPGQFSTVFLWCVGGGALGVVLRARAAQRMKTQYIKNIEYFLPLVMERIVMSAQAGLDVLPAIIRATQVDQNEKFAEKGSGISHYDPVSRLLVHVHQLTESGLLFEQAIRHVADRVESSSFRHALLHLGIAYREGGALVAPLRELSDATQLYYQESVEEEIAKMPIKATLPLLCMFAGLLLFFLASPLTQIVSFLSKARPEISG